MRPKNNLTKQNRPEIYIARVVYDGGIARVILSDGSELGLLISAQCKLAVNEVPTVDLRAYIGDHRTRPEARE